MRRRRVWRYYCDHCRRGRCSKAATERHESRCTLNPERLCGFCALRVDVVDVPLASLVALLPVLNEYDLRDYGVESDWSLFERDLADGLVELRNLTDCPACTLAALRISGIGALPMAQGVFDYKAERDAWWSEHGGEINRPIEYCV